MTAIRTAVEHLKIEILALAKILRLPTDDLI